MKVKYGFSNRHLAEPVHRHRKQFHFGGGGGGANVIYTAIAVICATCMNINMSRG